MESLCRYLHQSASFTVTSNVHLRYKLGPIIWTTPKTRNIFFSCCQELVYFDLGVGIERHVNRLVTQLTRPNKELGYHLTVEAQPTTLTNRAINQ